MSTALATTAGGHDRPPAQLATGIVDALEGLRAIRTFIAAEFRDGTDMGVIPGCGKKPALLLPGAQKATMYFNCFPSYKVREKDLGGGHVEFRVRCLLMSRVTGQQIGEGIGCASTREAKFARTAGGGAKTRKCPSCGKDTVFKSKKEGEGYFCWRKEGGCGQTFKDGHPDMKQAASAEPAGEAPYEMHNTVLKMAKKRSHVDAAMTLACLSELFTQDIEDTYSPDAVRAATVRETEPDRAEDGTYHVSGEVIPPPPATENASGHGHGKYASPEQVGGFLDWLGTFVDRANRQWAQKWDEACGEAIGEGHAVPTQIRPLLNIFQAKNHLIKWAIEAERLDPSIVPEDIKGTQPEKFLAVVFYRDKDNCVAVQAEMKDYARKQGQVRSDAIYRDFPHLAPEGWAEEQAELADDADEAPVPTPAPKRKTKRELAATLAAPAPVTGSDNPESGDEAPWEGGRE